jgi:N-acetylneuraminic acid mutarotase
MCPTAVAQTSEWTWMGGSNNTDNQPGIYGTLGVSAAGNVPGSRDSATSWTGSNGNLWLFGGAGYDSADTFGTLSDLWEFNTSTLEWTWIGGSNIGNQKGVYGTLGAFAVGNIPGGRYGTASWTDNNGNFWLFGGYGRDSVGSFGYLNDLWEFNPTLGANGEWAWMGGSSTIPPGTYGQSGVYGTLGVPAVGNVPGSRVDPESWIDSSGNLWLFGGYSALGSNGYMLNDLWKFNPSTREWTWISGNSTPPTGCASATPTIDCGWPGVYGTLGVPAAGNVPGGRWGAEGWTDQNGNFWLFGGEGYTSASALTILGDLWEFNTSTQKWAWMGGSNAAGQFGVYGSQGVPEVGNTPGYRVNPVGWTDSNGNFWLFGGFGAAVTSGGYLNDLWEINPSSLEWAWMGGSSTPNSLGVYGSLGVPAAGNMPGERSKAISWTDLSGNFWLFGGYGYVSHGIIGDYNDLWEYQPSETSLPVAATPTFNPPAGTYTSAQSVEINDTTPGAAIYYTTNGATPTAASTLYTGTIPVSSSETIEAIAVAASYADSAVASAAFTINGPTVAAPTFNPPAGTYTAAQQVYINDAATAATIYYTTNGTTPTTGSSIYNGAINVAASETIEAIAAEPGYVSSPVASASYTIHLPSPTFTLGALPVSLTASSGGQASTTLTVTPLNGFNSTVSFECSGLPSGASCAFSPTTVTPPGTTNSTLTITGETLVAAHQNSRPLFPCTVLALAVGIFGFRKRRGVWLAMLLAVCFAGLSLLSACSSSIIGGGFGPTPVTSRVTLTATSGSIQQTTAVSLTVN